jgi:antitoxin MazE
MNMTIRSKVIKIGNSRGIRIPRTVLEQAGLTNEVEMTVEGNKLIIQASDHPRQGWEERFADMAEEHDDKMLDETSLTQWDNEDWTW